MYALMLCSLVHNCDTALYKTSCRKQNSISKIEKIDLEILAQNSIYVVNLGRCNLASFIFAEVNMNI